MTYRLRTIVYNIICKPIELKSIAATKKSSRMILKIRPVFVLLFCVTSLADARGEWRVPEEKDQLGNFFIEHSNLVDPFSAHFRAVKVSEQLDENEQIVKTICGQVNAKNKMGGYVGWNKFYVIDGLEKAPIIWIDKGPDRPILAVSNHDHYCSPNADVFIPLWGKKWNRNKIIDPDGEWTAETILLRAENESGQDKNRWLSITCNSYPGMSPQVSVYWGEIISFSDWGSFKADVRFKGRKMKRWKLTHSDGNRSNTEFERGTRFLKEFFKGENFTITAETKDGRSKSVAFDLSNLEQELNDLREPCGY